MGSCFSGGIVLGYGFFFFFFEESVESIVKLCREVNYQNALK